MLIGQFEIPYRAVSKIILHDRYENQPERIRLAMI